MVNCECVAEFPDVYFIHFELKFFGFRFDIENWSKLDLNPRPRAYRAHTQTTEKVAYIDIKVGSSWIKSQDLVLTVHAPKLLKNQVLNLYKLSHKKMQDVFQFNRIYHIMILDKQKKNLAKFVSLTSSSSSSSSSSLPIDFSLTGKTQN